MEPSREKQIECSAPEQYVLDLSQLNDDELLNKLADSPCANREVAQDQSLEEYLRTMPIQIYLADILDPFDAQSMLQMLTVYHESLMGNHGPLPEQVRETVIAGLRDCSNHRLFLAVEMDSLQGESRRAVGMAVCFVNYSTFRALPVINVHDLAVHPEYQGQGIGKALLENVIAYAHANQHCAVTLEVRKDNVNALKLYRRLGFAGIEANAGDETMLFGKLALQVHVS